MDAIPDLAKTELKVEDVNGTTDSSGFGYITGKVRNTSSRPYSMVYIEFNLYDDQGNLVGNGNDMVSNLEAHGTWSFKVTTTQGVSKYKLKDITGYH